MAAEKDHQVMNFEQNFERDYREFLPQRKACQLVKETGFIMRKSSRPLSPDNQGQYCLIDRRTGRPVCSEQYNATPGEIVDWIENWRRIK